MITKLRGNEFVRHNAIYLFAAVAVGALNYLYYPVLGRLMDPTEFGEVQTLVSLFLQATAYLTVMGLVTVHIVANQKNTLAANHTIGELEKLAVFMSLAVLLLTSIFSTQIKEYFQFTSAVPFVLLSAAIVITVPYIIRGAYVNGKKLFGLNAWSSVVGAGGKLVFSAILVAVGFGVVGALFGIILAQCIALAVAAYFATRHGFADVTWRRFFIWPDLRRLRPELKYAGLVLVCSLSITIFYSVDVIIVKHYFDPHTAGLYASVSTVARILFFLTVPISQVLMPSVRLNAQPGQNKKIFMKSLVLLLAVGGSILLAFWLMPDFIVGVLMGNTYREYAYLLPRLSLAVFIVSLLNLVATYYMALRVYTTGVLAVVGIVLTYFWMEASHDSLASVVNSLLYGALVTSVLFACWIGLKNRGDLVKNTQFADKGGA